MANSELDSLSPETLTYLGLCKLQMHKLLCTLLLLIMNMKFLHFGFLPKNFILSTALLLSKAVIRNHIYEELPKRFGVHYLFQLCHDTHRKE